MKKKLKKLVLTFDHAIIEGTTYHHMRKLMKSEQIFHFHASK